MKKFDVFQLPDGSYRAIKYGFNWLSLFLPWIWCFFVARLYGWGSVWIGVFVVGRSIGTAVNQAYDPSDYLGIVLIGIILEIGFAIWFAFNANEFRRRKYAQMEYQLVQKFVDAVNQGQAISIARKGNNETERNQGHQKISLAENFLKPMEGNARPQAQIAKSVPGQHVELPSTDPWAAVKSGGSQTVSPAEAFIAPTTTSSVRTKDISQLMMLVKEWARISDFNLAIMLDGTNQRLTDEIIEHLKISADQGKSQACYFVGEIYRLGLDGGLSRPVQARHWFEKAEEMGHPDAEEALIKLDMPVGQMEEASKNIDAKNDPEFATSNSTEGNESWSEEYQILNEYDPVVKDCHDELEGLDPLLSSQFRDEVVSDRKKATEIRDRLKAEHGKNRKALEAELEKKNNPYSSKELNEALAETRSLGQSAEEEFARVVEVMGEDIDVDDVIQRLKEKYDVLTPPENIDAQLEHWGILRNGTTFTLGEYGYESLDDAIAYAQIKLDELLYKGPRSNLQSLLRSSGYTIDKGEDGLFTVTSKDGASATLMADEFPRFIKGKISPNEIRQCMNYLSSNLGN